MSDKRIIDLPTLQQALGNDAWLVVDIESGATYKFKKSALLGLQALETQSQEVYGAINEVRSLAEDLVSDEYDATSAYAKGDYCIYNNTLYKCTTAIGSGGEAWNASHWSATKCDDELSQLKQSLDDKADVSQLLAILAPTTQLTSSHDMNSTDCGTYFQSGTSLPLNAPATAYNAYIFVVKARAWDRVQFWWCMNTKTLYIRQTVDWTNGSSSNWTAWKSVIDIN